MKKIIFLCVSVSLILSSCFKTLDNWYTNTSEYDGRFVVSTSYDEDISGINKVWESWDVEPEDDQTVIEDGVELWIYNSSANVADEIIIDMHLSLNLDEAGFPVKGKFKITGDPSNFSGQGTVSNISSSTELNFDDDGEFVVVPEEDYYDTPDYYFRYDAGYPGGKPQSLGEEWDGIQLYTRLSMEECRITPLGATSIGGNKTDGVILKVTTYCDLLVIESYQTPQNSWKDPEKPEFAWRIKEGSRKNADGWEEHWTLEGYRYTGYPEDFTH